MFKDHPRDYALSVRWLQLRWWSTKDWPNLLNTTFGTRFLYLCFFATSWSLIVKIAKGNRELMETLKHVQHPTRSHEWSETGWLITGIKDWPARIFCVTRIVQLAVTRRTISYTIINCYELWFLKLFIKWSILYYLWVILSLSQMVGLYSIYICDNLLCRMVFNQSKYT